MEPVRLRGGAYKARSVIANAQRCVNLFPEPNPEENQPAAPMTLYGTPGLRELGSIDSQGRWRGLYRATDGQLFGVKNQSVYYIDPAWNRTVIGTIAPGTGPVSMKDNGLGTLVLVDGTINGYTVDLETHSFAQISDPAFYGADRVDYLGTYLLFNRPGTNQFYTSLSNSVSFSALDIAAKSGGPDPISSLIVVNKAAFIEGLFTGEVWNLSGSGDFPLAPVENVMIQHGSIATHSISQADAYAFWLAQNDQGKGIAMMLDGYNAKRISNHALEVEWQQYQTLSDAIGFTWQQGGHVFYTLVFPQADKTYTFDLATGQWHQWAWVDNNGKLHRTRVNCCTFAYGVNVGGDYSNGKLYALDPEKYTDDGQPIVRIRTFPHLMDKGNRVIYSQFLADMEIGSVPGHALEDIQVTDFNWDFNDDFGANPSTLQAPRASLRTSTTRGASWGNPVARKIGSTGQYGSFPYWGPLGCARDMVFELSWSVPGPVALNGAFIRSRPART